MTLAIVPVHSRAELREFITLPRLIYRGMPGFVAPLDRERSRRLDPSRAPFYTHGEAAYWLARRDGRTVGRVSAQIDRLAVRPESAGAGFFGCLDTIDDPSVAAALLRTAEAWILAHGRRAAQGPFLLSSKGESGLLIAGQDAPPMVTMPWHPAWLQSHLVAAGYQRTQTLLTFSLAIAELDAGPWERRVQRLCRGIELRLRQLRLADLATEAQIVSRIFNDGWASTWGFTPLDDVELKAACDGLRPFLIPSSCVFAERGGEPAGFILGLPNVYEITADLGGAPGLIGWVRFVSRYLAVRYHIFGRRYRSARVLLMGILSKYHSNPVGGEIALAMISEMILRARQYRIESLEAGWVPEQHTAMVKILRLLGFQPCRTYGVFEKTLTDPE